MLVISGESVAAMGSFSTGSAANRLPNIKGASSQHSCVAFVRTCANDRLYKWQDRFTNAPC